MNPQTIKALIQPPCIAGAYSRRIKYWKVLLALCLAPSLLIGCHGDPTLSIVLPAAYKGHVGIGCHSFLKSNLTLDFDSSSHGVDISCPKLAKQVIVLRGKVAIDPLVIVDLADDGTPVAISFDVQ